MQDFLSAPSTNFRAASQAQLESRGRLALQVSQLPVPEHVAQFQSHAIYIYIYIYTYSHMSQNFCIVHQYRVVHKLNPQDQVLDSHQRKHKIIHPLLERHF